MREALLQAARMAELAPQDNLLCSSSLGVGVSATEFSCLDDSADVGELMGSALHSCAGLAGVSLGMKIGHTTALVVLLLHFGAIMSGCLQWRQER